MRGTQQNVALEGRITLGQTDILMFIVCKGSVNIRRCRIASNGRLNSKQLTVQGVEESDYGLVSGNIHGLF